MSNGVQPLPPAKEGISAEPPVQTNITDRSAEPRSEQITSVDQPAPRIEQEYSDDKKPPEEVVLESVHPEVVDKANSPQAEKETSVELPDDKLATEQSVDQKGVRSRPIDKPEVPPLTSILFDRNSVILGGEVRRRLEELAHWMDEHDAYRVVILGYTDSSGDVDYNRRLSSRRAAAVGDFLTRQGVESQRMRIEGRGVYPDSKVSAIGRSGPKREHRMVTVQVFPPDE